jgi:hypothetical protein
MKVTNYAPDCDAVGLETGDYLITIYVDGEHAGGRTHVDIHNRSTNTTKTFTVGEHEGDES